MVIAAETTEPSLTGYYYATDGLPVVGASLGELGETSIYFLISEDDLQAIEGQSRLNKMSTLPVLRCCG